MKRLITSVLASTVLMAGALFPHTGHAALAATKPAMSVKIVSASPTTISGKHTIVTFHLQASGITLDITNMGKASIAGHGHFQIYVDRIPNDAYAKKDLNHSWLASLTATTVSLNLAPALIGGRGTHKIIVALARNDYVLYKVATASVTITAK